MQIFFVADLAVLDRVFQPFADWWRNMTGKSNFWLVRMLCWLALIALTWMCISNFEKEALPAFLIIGFTGASLFRIITMLQNGQAKLEERSEMSRTLNPMRLALARFRIRGWIFTAALATGTAICWRQHIVPEFLPVFCWTTAVMLLVLAASYFLSCTPKPRKPLRTAARATAR